MAYLQENFKLGRGGPNNHVSDDQMAIHTYRSETDAISSLSDPNYFPAFFGFDADSVKSGDVFYANFSNGDLAFVLSSVIDFTYLGSAATHLLTIPVTLISREVQVLGPFAAPVFVTTHGYKIGNIVYITVPFVSQTVTATGSMQINNFLDPVYIGGNTIDTEIYVINGINRGGLATYIGTSNTLLITPFGISGVPGDCGFGSFSLAIKVPTLV